MNATQATIMDDLRTMATSAGERMVEMWSALADEQTHPEHRRYVRVRMLTRELDGMADLLECGDGDFCCQLASTLDELEKRYVRLLEDDDDGEVRV